jgi:Na+/melibiose symporter-like transporter
MVCAPLSSIWIRRLGNKVVVSTGLLVVTASLLLVNTLNAGSSTLSVIAVTVVMGLGMANIMAPATDSIMGSLPRAKAGVGSAVNDTTRQVGGAVGVAVLGSIMASHFTSEMTSKLGNLPPAVLALVQDNVGTAIGIARTSPEAQPFAGQIIAAANDSFVSGMHLAFTIGAAVTLLAAVGVALFLPTRAHDHDYGVAAAEPEPVPVGAG